MALPENPVAALQQHHEAAGLGLDTKTTRPGWLGEKLDLAYAIDVLHPLARRSTR